MQAKWTSSRQINSDKALRKLKAVMPTRNIIYWTSSFRDPPTDPWDKGCYIFYAPGARFTHKILGKILSLAYVFPMFILGLS